MFAITYNPSAAVPSPTNRKMSHTA